MLRSHRFVAYTEAGPMRTALFRWQRCELTPTGSTWVKQLSQFWWMLQRFRTVSFCRQIWQISDGFEAQKQDPRGEAHPAQGGWGCIRKFFFDNESDTAHIMRVKSSLTPLSPSPALRARLWKTTDEFPSVCYLHVCIRHASGGSGGQGFGSDQCLWSTSLSKSDHKYPQMLSGSHSSH